MAGPWEKYQKSEPTGNGPWSKYSEKAAAPVEKQGAAQAALESFGNAATLGYLPQVQAAVESILPNPSKGVDAELEAKGFKISKPDGYVQARDENIKRHTQQKADFPLATTAGTVAGAVGGGLMVPMGALAKGATLGAKALQGAKAGFAMGGLMNPGDIEGDVTLMPVERLKNAAAGGALGAAIPAGMNLLGKGADKLANYWDILAAKKATRSFGRPTPTEASKMAASGEDVAIGREALNSGAIPWLGTPGRIAGRVEKLKEEAGQKVGDLVKSAGSAKLVDSQKLANQVFYSPEVDLMRRTPGMEGAVESIGKQVETLVKNGKMDLSEAQALRQQIDKSINWGKATPDVGAAEGLKMQRTGIRDAMNEGINSLNPGAPKDQLLSANRRYGKMAQASDILEREIGRNQANRSISLTDTIAAGAGASTGNPAAALVLGAINKAGRTFGNSVQARGYDALAKALAKSPGIVALAESNPSVVSRLAAGLGQEATGGKQDYSLEKDPILNDPELLMLFKKDENLLRNIDDPQRRALIKDALKRLPAGQ